MLKLASLSIILICFSVCTYAQSLADVRLAFIPHYLSDGSSNNGVLEIQSNYNISPKLGTLGLEMGLLLHYSRSKVSTRSTDEPCNDLNSRPVILTPTGAICDTNVITSTHSRRSSNMRWGVISKLRLNFNYKRKLRFIPSVILSIEDQISGSYFRQTEYLYQNGNTKSIDWIKLQSNGKGIALELFIIPEIRLDYLIIPDWNLRLGVVADLVYPLSHNKTRNPPGVLFGGFLSKDLIPIK